MTADSVFYHVGESGAYLPTRHTEGPWDQRFQHGGPPAALLAGAVEQRLAGEDLRISRLSYSFLGPVPVAPLHVSTRIIRPGKRVRLIEATLTASGAPVIIASAWAIRPAPADLDADAAEAVAPAAPEQVTETDPTRYEEWDCGFLAATEWRFVNGGYRKPGPAVVWVRPRVGLLAGQRLSPVQQVALAADSANGVSSVLDIRAWTFTPPELTIHLLRPPAGEWLCLDAVSTVRPDAVGMAVATVFDRQGPVARSAQSLFVSRRLPFPAGRQLPDPGRQLRGGRGFEQIACRQVDAELSRQRGHGRRGEHRMSAEGHEIVVRSDLVHGQHL